MEKEIKLEDRNRRQSDGKQGSRNIFPEDKEVLFCMNDKDAKEFTIKNLTELKREPKREQKRPEFGPVDPVYERQKKDWDYVKETSVKNTGSMQSRVLDDKFVRNDSNPVNMHSRKVDDEFIRNVNNIVPIFFL